MRWDISRKSFCPFAKAGRQFNTKSWELMHCKLFISILQLYDVKTRKHLFVVSRICVFLWLGVSTRFVPQEHISRDYSFYCYYTVVLNGVRGVLRGQKRRNLYSEGLQSKIWQMVPEERRWGKRGESCVTESFWSHIQFGFWASKAFGERHL